MLDIVYIREHPELVKESQRKRGMSEEDIDRIVELDRKWRELKEESDHLRARRNKLSLEINETRKKGQDITHLIKEAKELPTRLEEKEKVMTDLKEKRDSLLKEIPNLVDKSVPTGDASHNKVLKTFGKIKKLSFPPKDHADILEALDLLDTKKAGDVAGSRFYYFK